MASFSDFINGDTPTLVDFFATWCGPCKTMAPILDEVKANLKEQVSILKIDVDKNPKVAQAYQIQGVPTLILFKKGKIIWRQSGVVPSQRLVKLVHQHS